MEKVGKRLIKNKIFLIGVIPVFLFVAWIVLTIIYIINLDTAFSVLSYNESNNSFTHISYGKLTKGKSIVGDFTARDNNLGIIAIRFQTFFRPSYTDEDKLFFQLKEQGSQKWYYERIYRDGLIYDLPFFPFGFPVIANSNGKNYEFRITSLSGNTSNSVAVDNKFQILTTKYKYYKRELLHNKTALITFTGKKFINSLQSINVLFSSIVYLLPFVFYIVIYFGKRQYTKFLLSKKVNQSRILRSIVGNIKTDELLITLVLNFLLLSFASIDIIYLQLQNNMVYFIFILLWISLQRRFRVGSQFTFIFGIFSLIVSAIFSTSSLSFIAEEFSIYAYLLFLSGVIQLLMEFNGNEQKIHKKKTINAKSTS